MSTSRTSLRRFPWQVVVTVCLLVVCVSITLFYSLWASQRKTERHISLFEASMQIDRHDLLGHQKLRQTFEQENYAAFGQALDHFARAYNYVVAMLQGGELEQRRVIAVRDPALRSELQQLLDDREGFQKMLARHWAERNPYSKFVDPFIDPGLQSALADLIQTTDAVQTHLHNSMQAELHAFRLTQYILLAAVLILFLASVFVSWRFMRQRNAAQQTAESQKEKLRQRETALRHLFDNAPIGIFRTTSDGRTLEANPAIKKMLRIDTRDHARLYGQDLEHTLYADSDQRAAFIRRLDAQGQVEQFEIQGQRADGTWAWFSLNARVSERQLDQSLIIDGFMSEITQQKQAQESVEHLNRVLRAIRNINHLIMSEKDRERLIQQGCRILVQSRGFEAALIILTDPALHPLMHAQEGMHEALADFEQYLQSGQLPACCRQAADSVQASLMDKSSSACVECPLAHSCEDCDTLCIALVCRDCVYGFLAVALPRGQGRDPEEQFLLRELASDIAFALHGLEQEDITKKAEEEKRIAEKQLARAQKMEAIGRLAGGVAHDFNNMLGVIIGYADMALDRAQKDESLHYPLEQIRQAAQRSADLTRQLLAFSRKQLTQPQVLNLNQEIEKQRNMLDRLIGENIAFNFVPASDIWLIRVDPSQIDQILANLIINARDAISGTGSITLETMNVTLDRSYADGHTYVQPGEYVCMTVSDTGKGMDRQTQEHIFDPFFSTKHADQGTGLGLSTVYGIVKQNKGFIHVYSEPGRGSTFKLYFSRTHAEILADEEVQEPGLVRGEETVLLVEDEKMVLELTRAVLEEQGYTVLATRSPGQAQQMAADSKGPIHVLLTDVVLPEMNGRELKTALESIRPGMKTLFMSGYTENVIVQQGMVDPQFHFIHKPFSAAGLARKLREVLEST